MARMRILTEGGINDVELRTFRARSTVGRHWNAVQSFLVSGESDALEPFARTLIKGRLLLTDPDEIERLARIGELDVDDIYEDQR